MFYAKHAQSLEKDFVLEIIIIVQCDKMRLGGKSGLAKENTSTTNVQRKCIKTHEHIKILPISP